MFAWAARGWSASGPRAVRGRRAGGPWVRAKVRVHRITDRPGRRGLFAGPSHGRLQVDLAGAASAAISAPSAPRPFRLLRLLRPLRAGLPVRSRRRRSPTNRNRPPRWRSREGDATAEGGCRVLSQDQLGYPRISCGRTSAASGGRPVLRSSAPSPEQPLAASAPSSPEQRCVRGRRCGHRGSADSASCPRSCLLLRISDDGPSPDSHVGKKGAFRAMVGWCDSSGLTRFRLVPPGRSLVPAATAGKDGPRVCRDQVEGVREASVMGAGDRRRARPAARLGAYGPRWPWTCGGRGPGAVTGRTGQRPRGSGWPSRRSGHLRRGRQATA